ncbi:hypothetical protein BTUL_0130g00220 [Botrytis tulipae]|uniref:Uncharacterized protein n=1 Tax=Botrytis tulipae TaxID=87230 RepID=A0A4Z1EE72_9HELO|nr:hypothetical protein BTUL_0130g00220 [Botrytis tulipae]
MNFQVQNQLKFVYTTTDFFIISGKGSRRKNEQFTVHDMTITANFQTLVPTVRNSTGQIAHFGHHAPKYSYAAK